MTRTLRITYSLSFLGLLVGMGAWSTGGLQSFQRTEQMTLLNGKLAKAAETHYDAEFPIKRLGTNVWAAMDFKLFNEGRPGVVLGRDQWLFSDEEFAHRRCRAIDAGKPGTDPWRTRHPAATR